MILLFQNTCSQSQIENSQEKLQKLGLSTTVVTSSHHTLIIVLDDVSTIPSHVFSQLPAVERIIRTRPQCSLVLKNGAPAITINSSVTIGSNSRPVIIAGPCSIESQPHAINSALSVKNAGASMLRGGAFKPRTSPYDFQGLGIDGLKYLAEARSATGLPVVSEVLSAQHVEAAQPFVDVLQVGARNMYNFELLKEVGRSNLPVLLKRGFSATIQELLNAAEYIMLEGNTQIILCERGIRTFETYTRNTLDLSAVVALKNLTSLPVIVDPSHATGRPELVRPLSRAAIACGADGLMIEVHDDPSNAMSDGEQAITSASLREIVEDADRLYAMLHDDRQKTKGQYTAPLVRQPVHI